MDELTLAYKEELQELVSHQDFQGYMKLENIEEELLQLPQKAFETVHCVCDGVYTREIFVEAGTLLTGKRHTKPCINILTKGAISVSVVDEDGVASPFKLFKAPYTFVSQPGSKKVGYCHEDVHFINSFSIPDNYGQDDIELIEKYLFDEGDMICQQ